MSVQVDDDAATHGAAGTVRAEVRDVFNTGRSRSLVWRFDQLRAVERMCDERESDIAAALLRDLGRSAVETFLLEVATTKGEAAYARKHLKKWIKPKRQGMPLIHLPGSAHIRYEPLGAVLIIGAWNYPFNLCFAPLVGAIAAGNVAVIKPSELAPATSALVARLVHEYLDPEAIRVVEGDASTTLKLLAEGFDHALFTGGTEVGRKILEAAAPTLTPVTLELGGKSPVIVAADADLDVAARRIAMVKLLNSGQGCVAPDYVLVERGIAEILTDKIVANMTEFRSAEQDPSLKVANERQFDRLMNLLRSTRGQIVAGGGSDPSRLRVEPTVIVDPFPDDPVMTEEIFGPILPVITVDSLDAAVAFVNNKPAPLALYVFTASQRIARDMVDRIPSGAAVINHLAMHFQMSQLPFGGVGASGMGAYHGKWGFEAFSHRRAVLAKPAKPDLKLIYPPYSERTVKIMRRLF